MQSPFQCPCSKKFLGAGTRRKFAMMKSIGRVFSRNNGSLQKSYCQTSAGRSDEMLSFSGNLFNLIYAFLEIPITCLVVSPL
jgi:hypothetical protein